MRMCSVLFALFVVVIPTVTSGQIVNSRKVATVYDILQLIYRLCVADGDQRVSGLQCVDYHMGAEVSEVLEKCMVNHRIRGEDNTNSNSALPTNSNKSESTLPSVLTTGVDRLCDKLTLVEEWTEKHNRPPHQLTTVIGIEALGRMTCVMGSVQRPLPTWTAAFSKCFSSQEIDRTRGKTKDNLLSAADKL